MYIYIYPHIVWVYIWGTFVVRGGAGEALLGRSGDLVAIHGIETIQRIGVTHLCPVRGSYVGLEGQFQVVAK